MRRPARTSGGRWGASCAPPAPAPGGCAEVFRAARADPRALVREAASGADAAQTTDTCQNVPEYAVSGASQNEQNKPNFRNSLAARGRSEGCSNGSRTIHCAAMCGNVHVRRGHTRRCAKRTKQTQFPKLARSCRPRRRLRRHVAQDARAHTACAEMCHR